MKKITGKSVFQEIGIGKLHFLKMQKGDIKRYHIEEVESEIGRFENARCDAINELQELYTKALASVGEANAAIFEIHQMMLEDDDYIDSVKNIIVTQKVNAEYAIGVTCDNFSNMFAKMEDTYMQGRAVDIKDISNRLLLVLSGETRETEQFEEPVIIAADDLVPSETIKLDRSKILGFVIQNGSVNSHTAILARSMGIPALVGMGETFTQEYHGLTAIIDGFTGDLYIEPEDRIIKRFKEKKVEIEEQKKLLSEMKGLDTITLDGKKINLYANIGNVSDVASVLQNDGEGIGLFRSEFLYLENQDFPTEEEQFAAYKSVVQNMAGKKVIIRTLDLGADKQADYFELEKEENPALGYRAIRICLTRPALFKTQLRAILRAGIYGEVAVMFPMIISLKEVEKIKVILEETKEELRKDGILFQENIETGIMIETPASVLIADELAKEVDFFSIGTNDLTQYTLAIDRQNQKLDEFYDAHHKAILKMIQMTIESAHKEGKWVGICGELASDMEMTELFLKMGIDELSVSPSTILKIRKIIREIDITK